MLVVLGGFIGNGRTALARKLARSFGLYFYDTGQHKLRGHYFDRRGQFVERTLIAHTEDEDMRVCRHAAGDLPLLSKLHSNVVMEYPFHRERPREYFLREAARYFKLVVFIWIDADDVYAQKRLEKMRRQGKFFDVAAAQAERDKMKTEFEPFGSRYPVYLNTGRIAESAPRLWGIVQELAASSGVKSLLGSKNAPGSSSL